MEGQEKEIKSTYAETHFEIWVTCPYCDEYQNRVGELKEHLPHDELRADECEAIIKCESCKQNFLVEEIQY